MCSVKKKNRNGKQSLILTRETLGMTVLLFCLVVAVMLLTHKSVFDELGVAVCTFMYGTFGYGSYLVLGALGCLGFWLVFEKFPKVKLRCVGAFAALVFAVFLLFHAVSTRGYELGGYGGYLSACFNNAANGYSGYTFGGVISGLLVYPIAKGTTFIGAYVIFSLIVLACAYLNFIVIRKAVIGDAVAKSAELSDEEEQEEEQPAENHNAKVDNLYSVNENYEIVKKRKSAVEPRQAVQPKTSDKAKNGSEQDSVRESDADRSRRILFEPGEFAAESYRRNLIYNENSYFNHPVRNDEDYLKSFSDGKSSTKTNQTPSAQTTYTSDYSEEVEKSASESAMPSYIYGEKPVENLVDNIPSDNEERSSAGYDSYTVNSERVNYEENNEDTFEDIPEPYAESEKFEPPVRENVNEKKARVDYADFSVYEEKEEDNDEQPAQEQPENLPNAVPSRDSGSNSLFNIFSSSNPNLKNENAIEPDVSALQSSRGRSRENLFDDDNGEEDNLFGETSALTAGTKRDLNVRSRSEEQNIPERNVSDNIEPPARGVVFGGRSEVDNIKEEKKEKPAPIEVFGRPGEAPAVEEKPQPAPEKPKHVWKKYVRPSLDLLDDYPENNNVNTGEIEESKQIICETLASFRIASQVSNVVVGPAITRYDVIIEDKTNIKNALKYREAIAMALMKENVNAYLNYSKGAISIEVPNSSRTVVGLKSMLASSQFINCKKNTLTFALGKNVEGQVVCPDITKMPHLLVAGTTGSGKSICLSALIVSLLYKYGPEELRFILVDPKQVEFISYDKLPHLMINEIIYDVDKAIKALNWAIKEMENRYALFKEMTEKGIATKNLTEYNAHLPEGEEKLPKIVVILDEFGDLMLQAKKEIESRIIRLVQKARACGIHLILATQRPSVDCITGLIKSNLPTRIGFKVNSFDDARCIFDIGGAEKLLGKGDLYFRSAENPELARVQGCFIDTHEVQRVTDFVKEHNETYFDQTVSDFINTVEEPAETGAEESAVGNAETKIDDTFIKALKFCVTSNQASVSMIQRRFPIGYMKACKIIDWMENMNYITQSEGSKPRKVLLSREEFVRIFGDIDD